MAEPRILSLKPVYLIHGKEELLLERALHRLKVMALEAAGGQDLDSDTFAGESASAADVLAAANTLPFLSERRLVIVRDVDKMAPEDQALVAAYAEDPAPFTVLVLVASSLAKNTRLYRALDRLGAASEYAAPSKQALPEWVVSLFRSYGRSVPRDGAEALIRAVGRDLRRLQSEVEKVVAFAGERTKLTRADVEAVVEETAAPSVFEMLDAMGSRDCRTALRLLAAMLDAGEELPKVQALAVRHVRSLLSVVSMTERGMQEAAMASELRLAPWQVRNLVRQAKRFDERDLSVSLREAAKAEARMKTSQGDPRLVFERWLLATCGGRAR